MEGSAIEKVLYIYVADAVAGNPDNLPSSVISKMKGLPGPILRLAYVKSLNRVYIQDPSYRKLLSRGDEDAWGRLNSGLLFLGEQHGVKFPERAYGDPPGSSVKRSVSQYQKAWGHISRYMKDEFGVQPADVVVCEFAPLPGEDSRVAYFPEGGDCAGEKVSGPLLKVNRYMSRDDSGDVDFSAIGEAISDFYLENLDHIMATAAPKVNFGKKLARHKNHFESQMMFASLDGERTKVHKVPYWDRDRYFDEDSIRQSGSMANYSGPLLVFHYIPDPAQVRFQNAIPTSISKDDTLRGMLTAITGSIAAAAGVKPAEVAVTFDPSLSAPFVSKASRCEPLWAAISEMFESEPIDVKIVEAPLPLEKWGAALVRDAKHEDEVAFGAKRMRAVRGIQVDYPYILVDNRVSSIGSRYRAILREYARLVGEYPKESSVGRLRGQDRAEKSLFITHCFRLGMSPLHVVDMLADRGDTLVRAELWAIARESWKGFGKELADTRTASGGTGMSKHAFVGKGLGINDWWYIGSQEMLNQSQHVNDAPTTKPFNLKEKKQKKGKELAAPKTYEELLSSQHDKELPAQKSTEQLLRESRI